MVAGKVSALAFLDCRRHSDSLSTFLIKLASIFEFQNPPQLWQNSTLGGKCQFVQIINYGRRTNTQRY